MNKLFMISMLLVAAAISVAAQNQQLFLDVRDNYQPSRLLKASTGPNGVDKALIDIDGSADGAYVFDRFSNEYIPANSFVKVNVAPAQWWGLSTFNCDLSWDLHNLLPCSADVPSRKNTLPPGHVTTPVYTNGVWSTGMGRIEGFEVEYYSPPKGFEGDFARIMFYAITVYPGPAMWCDNASQVLADQAFPVLKPFFMRQLMAWHENDPVDDAERARSEKIAAIQGKTNPFVTNPLLAQRIWCDYAEDPPQGDTPGEDHPDVPEQPAALRPTYKLSDPWIYLYSPFIPDNASWSVDGKPVAPGVDKLAPATLGAGEHELRYTTPDDDRGRLLIRIIP